MKHNNEQKIQHLQRKYKKKRKVVPDEYDGVTIKDQNIPEDFASSPRTYGGTILTEVEDKLLSLPPKFATYKEVEMEECEAEIEKCLAKLRWEDRRKRAEENELPQEETNWHDHENKTMDFRYFRSTNLKFNQRITMPPPLDDDAEVNMQNLKLKLKQCTQKYNNEAGNSKPNNLTTEQEQGLKSLRRKKKEGEIVVFETDKSKRFSCDTPENYKVLAGTHMEQDDVVKQEVKGRYEHEINAHSHMWIRMLQTAEEVNDYERVKTSMTSHNNPPAPLAVLRKDHKPYDDAVIGPPGRPVCGGDVSYNKRLSNLISTILTDVYVGEATVCSSTEELLAEVERVNMEGLDERDIVGSADIEALYPSLDIPFTVDKVCEIFEESAVSIQEIDYGELGLYLSLNKTDEELQQMDLHNVCPRRRTNRGRRPKMTGCGMRENKQERHAPWIFPDISEVDEGTKRRMVVEALRIVLKMLLTTHTYEFAEEIRVQKKGGPIGMELTGVVAHVFLIWWDRQLKEKLRAIDFHLKLHDRYVDDTNIVARQMAVGARYINGQVVITDQSVGEDQDVPDDERTMKLFQSIASTIHPSIRVTIDYPSKHQEKKVPMLDLRMWIDKIDDKVLLLYEHYEKEMATKSVVHADSAIPMSSKRTIITQEVLRIILHCSNYLTWETVCGHINKFMMKMQYSGYKKEMRYHVVKSAINAYMQIREKEQLGIRPIHRPRNWRREERRKEKEQKKKDWYRTGGFDTVLFTAMTPNGKLKMYENEIRRSGLRIKVVERSGRTLKSQLQTSNPFKQRQCGREDCFICTTSNVGNCYTEGVTYSIDCQSTDACRKNAYKGETGSNGYTRGDQHATHLRGRNLNNSPLWRHCVEQHGGRIQQFNMAITGTFRNNAML